MEWLLTDYFCPVCGSGGVWVEDDAGDYYAGPDYKCSVCKSTWSMPFIDEK